MAIKGYHGAPGSYKTASAVYQDVLPALRAGRLVVTNIEGMRNIEDIEKRLGEKFPPESAIWRISSQTEAGIDLWRHWYCWMPCGALVVMDEIQVIYPNERTMKLENYAYKPITDFPALKEWMHERFYQDISTKPQLEDSSDYDDLGELIYTDDGVVIYPKTVLDSFSRHRKYNWDIVWCTPDITQILMLIRGASEVAYSHSNKDWIPLMTRRPRVREHPPKENGATHKKGNPTSYKKIPVEVHELYRSTATGKVTKSGLSKSPLQSLKTIGWVVLACLSYITYSTVTQDEEENPDIVEAPLSTGVQSGSQVVAMDSGNSSAKALSKVDIALVLPYSPKEIYLTGVLRKESDGNVTWDLYYELVTDNGIVRLTNKELAHMQVTAKYVTECYSNLIWQERLYPVYCRPDDQSQSTAPESNNQIKLFGT